jgi:hypothetical protein
MVSNILSLLRGGYTIPQILESITPNLFLMCPVRACGGLSVYRRSSLAWGR